MVFRFGEQELIPTIEELKSFLDYEHCLNINAVILTHKPNYLKGFHALDISKDTLPKEATGEYLHCPFRPFIGKRLEESW